MNQILYGKNAFFEYYKTGKKIYFVTLLESMNEKDKELIVSMLEKHKIKYRFEKKALLDRMSEDHQGIIAEVQDFEYIDLDGFLRSSKEKRNILMLDHIEDPRNFGAIIRSAEAAGVDAIIIAKDRGVRVNETVAKTSAGATAFVPIIQVSNLSRTCEKLKELGIWIVGTAGDAQQNYTEVDYTFPTCFIVGSEGKGISQNLLKQCDFIVSIPLLGSINSLNVSVAAAILVYEGVRQRGK